MSPARAFLVAAFGAGGLLAGVHAAAGGPARSERRALAPASASRPDERSLPEGVSVVAQARTASLALYRRPGARRPAVRVGNPTPEGVPRVLLVRRRLGGWVEVWLPVRPNGSRGWVRASEVVLRRDEWRVVVRLRRHRLVVMRRGRQAWRAPIATGRASTPTPRGRFFITELLRQPDRAGSYGPWAFALSGFSRVLTRFRGGHGEVGIHGTNEPRLLGRDVSHGCIRVRNADIERLARTLPLGTPVDVTS